MLEVRDEDEKNDNINILSQLTTKKIILIGMKKDEGDDICVAEEGDKVDDKYTWRCKDMTLLFADFSSDAKVKTSFSRSSSRLPRVSASSTLFVKLILLSESETGEAEFPLGLASRASFFRAAWWEITVR